MDTTIVGIDVAKDRLDVAVRPSGELFVVERNAGGLELLVERLKPLAPTLVVLEVMTPANAARRTTRSAMELASESLARARSQSAPAADDSRSHRA